MQHLRSRIINRDKGRKVGGARTKKKKKFFFFFCEQFNDRRKRNDE